MPDDTAALALPNGIFYWCPILIGNAFSPGLMQCEGIPYTGKSSQPIVRAIRGWFFEELRADIEALDGAYPYLGVKQACY